MCLFNLAEQCLTACQAVYDAPQIVAGPDGRDAASVTSGGPMRILAFRGTLPDGPAAILDWFNDLHAELVTDDRFPGRVHAGFLSSLTALWPELLGLAEQPAPDGKPLVITGHSKGGALAFLAGWLLRDLNPLVLTFAAPRAGNHAFASRYALRALRFENPADVVPHLPPLLYTHAGSRVDAPPWFVPPETPFANHSLATGYAPWVACQEVSR